MYLIKPQDQKVYLYDWDGKALKQTTKFEGNRSIISTLAFSPDGKYLAAEDVSICAFNDCVDLVKGLTTCVVLVQR